MSNVSSTITSGVTLTPTNAGSAKHTYDDFGLLFVEPTYSTKRRKDVMVSLPYADGVLDFSDQFNNRPYFENAEVTYRFARKFNGGADGVQDMNLLHRGFEDFCWDFKGNVSDDYRGSFLANARCMSFVATPHAGDNYIEIEVTFSGTPIRGA